MNNSLFTYDVIKKLNSLPMTKERREPHRDVFLEAFEMKSNQTRICDNVNIFINVDPIANEVIGLDFQDFLKRMNVRANLTFGKEKKSIEPIDSDIQSYEDTRENYNNNPLVENIEFLYFEEFAERDFGVWVDYTKITVTCGGIAGAWAALTDLEHKMKEVRGPVLTIEEYWKTAPWEHQISQQVWNTNVSVPDYDEYVLSDDAFRLYAHYGINEMEIYGDILVYSKSDILPELDYKTAEENIENLRKATERAAKYGIKFVYFPVLPKLLPDHPLFVNHPECMGAGYIISEEKTMYYLCSSSQLIRDYYCEQLYNIYKSCPLLGGSVFIVSYESFNHCRIWDDIRKHRSIKCPRCGEKSFEEIVALQVIPCAEAIKKANPNAFVSVWMYAFVGNRLDLLKRLPSYIDITYTLEKDILKRKDGYDKRIWDYSLESKGPVYDTLRLKKFAKDTNRKLFIKTETATGVETMQYPYVPAMQFLADKWESLKKVAPQGLQQSWFFYGMFGSRCEELAYWATYESCSSEEYIYRMAKRDFGKENADKVVEAWKYISEAVTHIPVMATPVYYHGPMFYGPAHPLLGDNNVPKIFNAKLFYLMEDEETFSKASVEDTELTLCITGLTETMKQHFVHPHNNNYANWNILIKEFNKASLLAKKAYKIFNNMTVPPPLEGHLRDERNIVELFYRTMITCTNVYKYFVARDIYKVDYKSVLIDEMTNARKSIHIYEEAPYLNLNMRSDSIFSSSIDMINEKISIIEKILQNKNNK